MKKVWILLLGILSIYGFLRLDVNAEDARDVTVVEGLCPGSTAAILFETGSNAILFQKEMHRRLPPASMTKIMTLLLIYEAIENKQINKSTMLTITEEPTKVEGSKAFLSIGDEINVDELLKCICIASANDAAIAMALHLAGSEAEFVKKMNAKVDELKLKNTHFSDCTGLSSRNHYTSAYDLAIISDTLIDHYPDVLNYTNIKEDYIRKDTAKPFWLVNTNKMIGRVKYLDGLKTGYTSFSKYCITLHMKQNHMSLISVVFGYDQPTTRNAESLELLRYGFSNYKVDKVVEQGKIFESKSHMLFKNKISIAAMEDVYYLCKRDENPEYQLQYQYDVWTNAGKVDVYLSNQKIGSSSVKSMNEPIKRNFFELWIEMMKRCFN